MKNWKISFEDKFGKCHLSICREHEDIQCELCKMRGFVEEILEESDNVLRDKIIDEIIKKQLVEMKKTEEAWQLEIINFHTGRVKILEEIRKYIKPISS